MIEPQAKIEPKALSRLLAEADAVVALNTSAEIEAAIAGKPVLTFRAGPEARGQEGSIHFTYLLEQNGGFVLDALTLDEHVEKLGAVLHGDWDPEPLRLFVETFVRPNGLERPVTPLLAEAILEAASVGVVPAGGTTATAGAGRPKGEPRILVFTPPGLTRFIPDVFLELLAADATLLFSGRRQKRPRIPSELKSRPHVEFVELPVAEPAALELLRAFRDAVRFHDPRAGGRLLAAPARDATPAKARAPSRLEARSAGARAAPDPAPDVRPDRRRARRPRAVDPVRRRAPRRARGDGRRPRLSGHPLHAFGS